MSIYYVPGTTLDNRSTTVKKREKKCQPYAQIQVLTSYTSSYGTLSVNAMLIIIMEYFISGKKKHERLYLHFPFKAVFKKVSVFCFFILFNLNIFKNSKWEFLTVQNFNLGKTWSPVFNFVLRATGRSTAVSIQYSKNFRDQE